jgi:peptidoglycan-associated lipoprotein
MTRFRHISLLLAAVAAIAVAGPGCASKKKAADEGVTSEAMDANTMGDSDSGNAGGLQTVHFPYDSFALDSRAKSTLKNNAQVLKDKPSLKIQVEGHCDQRGGIQYNIALGEKRANSVRAYLMDQGIPGDRITTISYGKERPVDQSMSESAFAKNRRANFVITAR